MVLDVEPVDTKLDYLNLFRTYYVYFLLMSSHNSLSHYIWVKYLIPKI
jgi:hypothetical protein